MSSRLGQVDWDKIVNFKPADFVKPEAMDPVLVYRLQEFRTFINTPIIITSAWATGGHTTKSMHYVGKAVDIIIPQMELFEAYLEAERWQWGGIGIYPHWWYKNKQVGGLHLDVRDGDRAARWWFDAATQKYADWNSASIKKLITKKFL